MSIAFRAVSTVAPGGGNTVTGTKPTGTVSTDVLIAHVAWDQSSGTLSTGSLPSGWTQIDLATNVNLGVWTGWALGSVSSLTWSFNNTITRGVQIAAYSGVDNTTPISAHSELTSTTTNPLTSTAITVPSNGWFILCAGCYNTGSAISAHAGGATTQRNQNQNMGFYDNAGAASGSITGSVTWSSPGGVTTAFAIALAQASSAITTTQTQSGKARIGLVTSQTQTGLSRITAPTTQTQNGLSRITISTAQTQSGESRVQVTSSQTQLGTARISVATTQTQSGLARITVSTNQTQDGLSRITATSTQTQLGLASIHSGTATDQTQKGLARISITTIQTQSGQANIKATTTETLTAVARIEVTTSQTQSGVTRIGLVTAQTITGESRITIPSTQTISGKSRITNTATSTILGRSSIDGQGAAQAIAFRAAGSTSGGSANSSLVLNKPTGVVANDLMLASVEQIGITGTITSVPSGWTLLDTAAPSSSISQTIYWKIAGSSEPSSYTWSFSGLPGNGGAIVAYSNCDITTPISAHSENGATSGTSITSTAITVPTSGWLVVFFGNSNNGGPTISSAPSGLTQRFLGNTVANATSTCYDSNAIDAGSKTASITWNTSAALTAVAVALNPATGGTTTYTRLQYGVSRITAETTQTQTGVSSIATTSTQTQKGQARVTQTSSTTLKGQSRVTVASSQTLPGKANVRNAITQTIDGLVRITATTSQTIQGRASLSSTVTATTQTQTGVSNILNAVTQTQLGQANVRNSTTQTLDGTARIQITSTQTLSGKSRITATEAQTLSGKARITQSVTQTHLGRARITVTTLQTITGKGSIVFVTSRGQLGLARISSSSAQTITGKASLLPAFSESTRRMMGQSLIRVPHISYPHPTATPLADVFAGAPGAWPTIPGKTFQLGVFYEIYFGSSMTPTASQHGNRSLVPLTASLDMSGAVNKIMALAFTAFTASLNFTVALTKHVGALPWALLFTGRLGRKNANLGNVQPGVTQKLYIGSVMEPTNSNQARKSFFNILANLDMSAAAVKDLKFLRSIFTASLTSSGSIIRDLAFARTKFAANLVSKGSIFTGLYKRAISRTLYASTRLWDLITQARAGDESSTSKLFIIAVSTRVFDLVARNKRSQ